MRNKLTLVAAAVLLAAGHAAAADYSIGDLTARYGAGYTWTKINNAGELAGTGGTVWDRTIELRLHSGNVSYQDNSLANTWPSALANDGTLYYQGTTYTGTGAPLVFGKQRNVDGTITEMPAMGATWGYPGVAKGVNDSGVAIGYATDDRGYSRAVVFHDGRAVDLGTAPGDAVASGINNHGAVVGHYTSNQTWVKESFIYENGKITTFGRDTEALRINDANVVAGNRILEDGSERAFLYQDGVMKDISVAGKSYSETIDLNNSGALLGWAANPLETSPREYFVYINGETIVLNDIVASAGYADWTFDAAYDINDKGQVLVGLSREIGDVQQTRELLLTPTLAVPEPGTWAMLLAGFACVGLVKRRRAAAA